MTADDPDHQLLPVAKLAALEIVRHLWVTRPGERVAAEDVEPTPLASDLLRRFRMPGGTGASTPAEQAFGQLRGWRAFDSLAELVKHTGRPLVSLRCAERDRSLLAGVWRTAAGPLLVTCHRVGTLAPTDWTQLGQPRALRGAWAPRVTLTDGDLSRALPLPCVKCGTERTTALNTLLDAVKTALATHPATVRL